MFYVEIYKNTFFPGYFRLHGEGVLSTIPERLTCTTFITRLKTPSRSFPTRRRRTKNTLRGLRGSRVFRLVGPGTLARRNSWVVSGQLGSLLTVGSVVGVLPRFTITGRLERGLKTRCFDTGFTLPNIHRLKTLLHNGILSLAL